VCGVCGGGGGVFVCVCVCVCGGGGGGRTGEVKWVADILKAPQVSQQGTHLESQTAAIATPGKLGHDTFQ
jgi:hypothetical protein